MRGEEHCHRPWSKDAVSCVERMHGDQLVGEFTLVTGLKLNALRKNRRGSPDFERCEIAQLETAD